MTLAPGARLGPYEIVAPLGAGGMGEVYRARDTKLNRDVAIKILPEAVAHDTDRVARFIREAQTLAALNHPNIAQIYGVVEAAHGAAHVHALVMELVEGEDLLEVIARGPAPIPEAALIAKQIAEALEAAHEQGIIHRDLKPANVKIRADGTVKVLDFGLAKAVAGNSAMGRRQSGAAVTSVARSAGDGVVPGSNPADSPTVLSPGVTALGSVVGTAAYMSPEQARGKAVDKRSDVWAFGCVLYEMLTGVPAFEGRDTTEIIAAIIKTEPDWTTIPAEAPPRLVTVASRCLVKERRERVSDFSVVRFMLEGPARRLVAGHHPAGNDARRARGLADREPGVARHDGGVGHRVVLGARGTTRGGALRDPRAGRHGLRRRHAPRRDGGRLSRRLGLGVRRGRRLGEHVAVRAPCRLADREPGGRHGGCELPLLVA